MLEKIKTYQNHPRLQELRDVRVLGQAAFLVIVLLVSWSGVKVIQTNYELQQQISQLRQEIAVQRLENTNLELRNQYYDSDQYLELAARQNFGLAAPGEKELLVPKEVALAHAPDLSAPEAPDSTSVAFDEDQPFYRKNMQDWLNFFLNRHKSI